MRSFGTVVALVTRSADGRCSKLLNNKPMPVCYDGFEPSGRMHIAQGIMKANNVNKLTKAGALFRQIVALCLLSR